MKSRIQFVLRLIFGLMFINAGLNKLFHYLPVPDDLPAEMLRITNAMTEVNWLLPLVAFAEITGGILIIPGRFKALGALVITPVMAGILLTHVFYAPSGLPLVVGLLAILIWVMVDSRAKLKELIG